MSGFVTKKSVLPSTFELHCGDCSDVMHKMRDGSTDLIIADPPYGARMPSQRRVASDVFAEVHGNDKVRSEWIVEAYRVLADGGATYVFVCWDVMHKWRRALRAVGFKVRSCIVWDKVMHGSGALELCWAPQHEMILFAAKGRHELRGKRPKDVVRVQRVDPLKLVHPYEKPLPLLRKLIEASTDEGQTVLDPFMGSGTTGLAAMQCGRGFTGIEIDRKYFELAERRIKGAPRRAAR